MKRSTLLLFLVFFPHSTWAQGPLLPNEPVEMTPVSWGDMEEKYYPIQAGSQLNFPLTGPIDLTLEMRLQLAADAGWTEPVELVVLGDGNNVLNSPFIVAPNAVPDSTVDGMDGSRISEASSVHLQVPGGEHVVTLKAPAESPTILLRIIIDDSPEIVTNPAPTASVDDESSAPEAEPVPSPLTDETAAPLDESPVVDPNIEPTPSSLPVTETAPHPEKDTESAASDHQRAPLFDLPSALTGLQVGPRIGMGLPSWGSGLVPSLAARAYLPIWPDLGGVAATLGWYRLNLSDEERWIDPFMGPQDQEWSWKTRVFHLSADALFHSPWDLGPVQPFAGSGIDLYLARRVFEDERFGGLSPGLHLYAGGRYALPYGTLEATLAWNGGRRHFDNLGIDREPVRESLASTQIQISWMMELP